MTTMKSETEHTHPPRPELDAIRSRLAAERGPRFWRSLEELADSPEFRELSRNEFPEGATEWTDPVGRREFLKLMGASLALAGLAGCTAQPSDTIVPYVRAPEEATPGKPLFYATAMTLSGCATGLLVESHLGRPTKVEGNPLHPASLGGTDVFAQAAILGLYDPDRSQTVTQDGKPSTWTAATAALTALAEAQRATRGAGLRILTETVTSPTLAAQLRALLARFPAARWIQYEPVSRDAVRAGARLAFGEVVNSVYRVDRADVILALDADFLLSGPGALRYAREFAARRRAGADPSRMNRLYAVESSPSLTGAAADHRFIARPAAIGPIAAAIARGLGVAEADGPPLASPPSWLGALVKDLSAHRGACLVVAGAEQPAAVHFLAHAMNRALGNVGRTVLYTDPVEAEPTDQTASLAELVAEMQAGKVQALLVLGGNPVYTAPADLPFADAFAKLPFRLHLSGYADETSARAGWHLPEAHFLEAWSDARAFDGTVSIVQPLITPLFGGRSAHEILAALLGEPDRPGYEIVREYWRGRLKEGEADRLWRAALHDGLVPGTALPPRTPAWRPQVRGLGAGEPATGNRQPATGEAGLTLLFRPDPTVWDGRFANNAWLQELPKSLTTLTWDNVALLSPATAGRLGLGNGDVVELSASGRSVKAPVWILPGQAEETLLVHLGYGRSRAGRVGSGMGFDPYPLRTAAAPWAVPLVSLKKTGERAPLAAAQEHHQMEGRNLVRSATLQEYREQPDFAKGEGHRPGQELSLYAGHPVDGVAWGMSVDLTACIGCNACTVACQAENNIPVVGKAEVARGREMHWIRVDRYYEGNVDHPAFHAQPVMCMHCENAPCEPVCPVGATVHSAEGLNDMVYNRCVGTRYCANNCPYKVRRFNFLQYADTTTPLLTLAKNPAVTVRTRGVMEKCTYCVQRISAARIQAKKEGREIQDGEVVTACQAACPTGAIVFGNLADPGSKVAALKASPLDYGLLTELNTRPRTSYLARLRNPNPEIEKA
jgi:molybdopterin-containing oxidoreductase family iron-sulfur binding subunit